MRIWSTFLLRNSTTAARCYTAHQSLRFT